MNQKKINPTALEKPELLEPADTDSYIQQVLNSDSQNVGILVDDTIPFAPRIRPPMAILSVFDDDQNTWQEHRLYQDETIIGRESGDIVIPHDLGISGEHLSIERRVQDGRCVWWLRDRNSRNGSFLKCQVGRLKHQQEFLIGSFRYQIRIPSPGAAQPQQTRAQTVGWENIHPDTLLPTVVQLGNTDSEPFPLPEHNYWIGRDEEQVEIVLDDPLVSPCHAKLCFTDKDGWHLQDNNSLNGIWLKFQQIRVTSISEFQLGEQRFSLKVFGS